MMLSWPDDFRADDESKVEEVKLVKKAMFEQICSW